MSKSCDGCGAEFSIEHTLDCRFGGLVSHHHEICGVIGDLASLVWGNVVCEPAICAQFTLLHGALVAGLCIRGVRVPQSGALFDICVVDTDAHLIGIEYLWLYLYSSAKHDQKKKYSQVCQDQRDIFTRL